MPPALVVLILSLLLGLQPVTTDLYLPALPSLTQGFGAPMPQAQLTLSALLLAFGVSQLAWGPLSDRFGRRPILLLGMAAYMAASFGSAFSTSMVQLIAWRVVQGVAMGAGVMGARAIVRDLYAPSEGARVMSKALTGLGVIACVSAPLGGVLADLFGWRAVLLAVAVFGALALALVALRFQETLPAHNPHALRPRVLASTWSEIVRHPTFRAFALLVTASYCGLFTFLAASSFVFIGVMGLSRTQYGLLMLAMSLSYLLGTFLCRWLMRQFGIRRTVVIAGAITLTAGTGMGLIGLAGVHGTAALMAPFLLFMLAHGVHQPVAQAGAVGPFPQAAGAASALNGFLMTVAAFLMGGWIGRRLGGAATGADAVLVLTQGIWFWSVLIAAIAWTLVQRHGEARPMPERLE